MTLAAAALELLPPDMGPEPPAELVPLLDELQEARLAIAATATPAATRRLA